MATRSLKARIPVAPLAMTASTDSCPDLEVGAAVEHLQLDLRVGGLELFQSQQAQAVRRAPLGAGQESEPGVAQAHEVFGQFLDALAIVHA